MCHKSNFRISWMYRYCFYDIKVHFWWPNKCSKHQVLHSNTLYLLVVNVWEKRFKLPQLTHESFLTLHHSCKIFFWYLPNWTSTDLWCVVLYVAYSTTHQRLVEVQFGRHQKNVLQEWSMVKKLSCVSCGSLKRFPHTFTSEGSVECPRRIRWKRVDSNVCFKQAIVTHLLQCTIANV